MPTDDLPLPYLRGIELFNAARFFEAHEVWEELWLPAEGTERQFLHALIQTAAALHHVQRGNLKGAASVWQRALAKFTRLPDPPWLLDLPEFVAECERYFTQALAGANDQLPFPKIQLSYGSKT
jgi:hypothetical protein